MREHTKVEEIESVWWYMIVTRAVRVHQEVSKGVLTDCNAPIPPRVLEKEAREVSDNILDGVTV